MKKIIVLLLLTFTNLFYSQGISIKSSTDKQKYLIGDYIFYSIEMSYPEEYKLSIPKIQDSIKQLEYLKSEKPLKEKKENKIFFNQKFVFSKYEPDTITIPQIKIELVEKSTNKKVLVSTSEIVVFITAYDVKDSKDIVDVKPPVKVPFDWWFVFYIALISLVIISAMFFVWKKWIKQKIKPELDKKIILPPDIIALNNLSELENKRLWQQGKIKEFHTEITSIIRKYFEDAFLFNALEMTSTEIIDEIKKNERLKVIENILDKFFQNADMVKFAKFQPLPSVNEEMLVQAYEIINKTRIQTSQIEEKNV